MNPRTLLKSGIFLVLVALAFPASAWYQVEVIVFQYLHPNPDGELLADSPALPDTDGAIGLTASGIDGAGASPFAAYRLVSPSRYRLGGVNQSLRSSHDYRPLLHVAWEQPGSGEGPSRLVHLEQLSGSGSADAGATDVAADPSVLAPATARIVDGTVRVRSGRFLHVDVDMAYWPGSAASDPQPAGSVRLRGTRKIKLNELHYLDHPLFGVLIEVSRLRADSPDAPLESPLEEEAEEKAGD